MAEHDLDALIVSGSEYSGFEGAVTYLSGFQIVHRYAYVVVPADGDPFVVFPSEARYVGEHGTARIEQVFHDRPGEHIADRARGAGWRRLGVYGLDYVMAVRDEPRSRGGGLELVPFDVEFDLARAVKSEAELESVRDSVRINERGFEIFLEQLRAREVGCRGHGRGGGVVRRRGLRAADDEHGPHGDRLRTRGPSSRSRAARRCSPKFLLPSLEVAGPGMHWVEVSRAIADRDAALSDDTERMLEAYLEYVEAATSAMRPGATCHDVHRAVSAGFIDRGYHLGHVTGHSIGMTMIEFPKIGRGRRDRASREHGASRCIRTRSPRTARTACTCRRPGW